MGKKLEHLLQIGFMNISGLRANLSSKKEDDLRRGVSALEFDIFGLAETNTDWRSVEEDSRLHAKTRGWWETTHINFAHNRSSPTSGKHQWGGTALFSINEAAHRVLDKGIDDSNLGRWCWTRYKGRNNHILRIVCAYRQNFPTGHLSVYSQHRSTLLEREDERYPRKAFLQDLEKLLAMASQQGKNIILMLDGNTNMIILRHGTSGPETFRRNKNKMPIDGIWVSRHVVIQQSGYLDMIRLFLAGTIVVYGWISAL